MKESDLPMSCFRRRMPTFAFLSKQCAGSAVSRSSSLKFPGTVVRSQQQAKRVAIDFAGELHGEIRIDDRARVHGRDLRVEDVDAFEEERSLLCKEDREALVRSDDQLV